MRHGEVHAKGTEGVNALGQLDIGVSGQHQPTVLTFNFPEREPQGCPGGLTNGVIPQGVGARREWGLHEQDQVVCVIN
jgi:hypothetical protein